MKFISLFAASLTFLSSAVSAEVISPNGKAQVIKVRGRKSITIDSTVRGNSTSVLSLTLQAPQGSRVSLKQSQVKGRSARAKAPVAWKVPLRDPGQIQSLTSERGCIQMSPGGSGEEETSVAPLSPQKLEELQQFILNLRAILGDRFVVGHICPSLSTEQIDQATESLRSAFGGEWNRENTCLFLDSEFINHFDPLGDEQSLTALSRSLALRTTVQRTALIRKDACASGATKYRLSVRIDLPQHARADEVVVALDEKTYEGGKAATIKPVSEGMYAPSPLVLMETITACGQDLSMVKWTRGKPKVTPIELRDLVIYRDMTLNRSTVGEVLGGGEASFDLENQGAAYGVCFELIQKRQSVNGYPIS